MREKTYFFPIFLISICLVFLIIFLGQVGVLGFVTNSVQGMFFPLGQLISSKSISSKESDVQKENIQLRQEVAAKDILEADNKALRDQFETTSIPSRMLFPAQVVGMPGVIPNISFPETLIIHVGRRDGVIEGSVVVYKNQFIGTVMSLQDHFSTVLLITAKKSSFPVKDSTTGAIGVMKGQGNGELLIESVLLSDELAVGDTIVTTGTQNESGKGIAPDLVVGRITSIEKNPSSLFQKARVTVGIGLNRLSTVFIIK